MGHVLLLSGARRAVLILSSCALSALLFATCEQPELISVGIGNRVFTVEVARTAQQKAKGLMDRDSIPSDHGMIFVYDQDQPMAFWMKNTRVPLSIAFLSKDGRITEIRDMRPQSLDSINSRMAVRYALEVNLGAFREAGVGEGDVVRLPEGFP